MTLLALFACIALVGITFIVVELFNAPEGFEDESGFHVAWCNNRPGIKDVSCIWQSVSQISNFTFNRTNRPA